MLRVQAHCFVTSKETGEALGTAFRDHRLGKITPTLIPGGFAAAEERYAGESSPALIVIETGDAAADGGEALLAQVAALAELCSVGSNLILLGPTNDVDMYRLLRRQGVADYLRLPLDPARLADAVRDLFEDPERASKGEIVAVVGAKGGCGSSTIACNLAHTLAELSDAEAILVDLDLHFGAGDLAVNIDTGVGVRNALNDPDQINELFLQRCAVRYDERLQLLAAPAALDADGRVEADRLQSMAEALRGQARWVVLDLPHQWTGWVQRALRIADTVVVVAPLDLPGLRNTRNLTDWLAAERPGAAAPHLLLTGGGAGGPPVIDMAEFLRTLGAAKAVEIPEDRDALRAASSAGRMIAQVRPRSRAALALRQFAAGLAGQAAPGARPKQAGGLLSKLRLERFLGGRPARKAG
ncbi:cellulose synthase operon protein YhjQ/BcsQ [Azospirillum sp. SYSU D00513]|uniref:AAA family ATPase n=1 Tax=Azospirillum sp. SYSU D00513 TaxID=2812561 RepID=UPI001A9665F4|nr:cellulose synthase operon protein YhjQ/BcsQ [Azospirillum sp. SYSU D00513]